VAIAKINSYLQEHITGIAVLQLFNRERRSGEEFEAVNREHMNAFKKAITAYGWFYPVVEFISMMALASILTYGGFRIRAGTLTLGVVVAFLQYGLRFFRPIQDLSEKYNILQSAMASSERVFKLLDTDATVLAPSAPRPLPDRLSAIEFDHVWFAYQDEDWVLRDASFTITPGETVAVVGHTGAGKTTLISLLLRFYDIQKGSIRLGDAAPVTSVGPNDDYAFVTAREDQDGVALVRRKKLALQEEHLRILAHLGLRALPLKKEPRKCG